MKSDLESIVAGMSVERLAQLSGKSVSEIAVYALSGSRAPSTNGARARRSAAADKPAKAAKGRKRRRAGGGREFDEKILAAVRAAGGPVRSVDLEKQVGGDPESRRNALKRLVKTKQLKRTGVARATRYEAR